MGEHNVKSSSDPGQLRVFTQKLLEDVRALEKMLAEGQIESGITRIGAEQEMFLVDPSGRPAMCNNEVLRLIDDPHFTTELARFNLECNLDPIEWGPTCLSQLEQSLQELMIRARHGAEQAGVEIALTGILPTLQHSDLTLESMTPQPRYFALAEAIYRMRGKEFEIDIKGMDELKIHHDSVMGEACNTSFQVHLQIDPADFGRLYNLAQAISGPVLASAVNSPVLYGRRLWKETRIALFQQSLDTRRKSVDRQELPRVSFGERWIENSALDVFRDDISRYKVLLSDEIPFDPFEQMARGEAPKLRALCLYNSTVYRWNRACYGVYQGKPHLRIENRYLPAGPTVIDEVANAAFWFGLMKALSEEFHDIRKAMTFEVAKDNFLAAARQGLRAQFRWMGHRGSIPAKELLCEHLLPQARQGLQHVGIHKEDCDRYLDLIQERVETAQTGSTWMLDSLDAMRDAGSMAERMAALTMSTIARQKEGRPAHTWPLARLREQGGWRQHYGQVRALMSTDLFTVNEHEGIDLAASKMDWRQIRHVPVEDDDHQLAGLVTHRTLLRVLAREYGKLQPQPISVGQVMTRDVHTVTPETPTLEAITLMRKYQISCLPVVDQGRLVGILTERDFVKIARPVLEDFLTNRLPEPPPLSGQEAPSQEVPQSTEEATAQEAPAEVVPSPVAAEPAAQAS